MDIWHHFYIIKSGWGWGLSNLVFAQLKCLIFFLVFALLVRFRVGFFFKLFQLLYKYITGIARENLHENAKDFNSILLFLFLFILFGNIYGLIPGNFSFNAHLIVTGCWAILVWLYCVYKGISINGRHFFSHFAPAGVPRPLLVVIVPMEVISFLLKPVSLALRLFINIMVGHIIMSLAEALTTIGLFGRIGAVFCLFFLTILEFFVCILQAYIFLVMSINLLKSCLGNE